MNILNMLSYIRIKGMCMISVTTLQFHNKSMQEDCNSSYNPFTLNQKSKMRYNLRTNVDFKGLFKWYELIILPGHVCVEYKLIYVKKWFLTKVELQPYCAEPTFCRCSQFDILSYQGLRFAILTLGLTMILYSDWVRHKMKIVAINMINHKAVQKSINTRPPDKTAQLICIKFPYSTSEIYV